MPCRAFALLVNSVFGMGMVRVSWVMVWYVCVCVCKLLNACVRVCFRVCIYEMCVHSSLAVYWLNRARQYERNVYCTVCL